MTLYKYCLINSVKMNLVNALARRSAGYGFPTRYDCFLYRLKCLRKESHYYPLEVSEDDDDDFEPESIILSVRLCPTPGYEHLLAYGNKYGFIGLHDTSSKRHQNINEIKSFGGETTDIAWMPGELKFIEACGDGAARLWQIANGSSAQNVKRYNAQWCGSLQTATFKPWSKDIFAVGSVNGTIKLWDIRVNDSQMTLKFAHGLICQFSQNDYLARLINHLRFQDEYLLLSCNWEDRFIKVWDTRKLHSVHSANAKSVMSYDSGMTGLGFRQLLLSPSEKSVYAVCLNNSIYKYDLALNNPKSVAEFTGCDDVSRSTQMCLSPDGQYLASCSGNDCYPYIWSTNGSGRPLISLYDRGQHNIYPMQFIDWCITGKRIVTYSTQGDFRIWRTDVNDETNEDELDGWAQVCRRWD